MTAKGNGKAMVPTEKAVAVRSYPTMSNESDVTTVEESLNELLDELDEAIEETDPLPSRSKAELGELCRVEGSVQFRNNDLLEGSEGLEVFEG
jgi:hypothetical protein